MPSTRWVHLPLPDAVRAMTALGRHVVAAVADGGVLCSSNGGSSWRSVLSGPVHGATTLLASPGVLWAGTTAGVVRATRAEGWHPSAGSPATATVTALAADDTTLIAGTYHSGVFRSTDGGTRWEIVEDGFPLQGRWLHVHDATDSAHGLVVAHGLGVSWSPDHGASWSSAGTGLPLRVPHATLASDGLTLYAGVGGRLYRAAPPGPEPEVLVWTEVYDGPGLGRPLDLLAASAGWLYATAPVEPFLYASGDTGARWNGIGDALPAPPLGLAVAPPWLLAVLPDGTLWRHRRPPHAPRLPPLLDDLHVETEAVAFTLRAAAEVHLTLHDPVGGSDFEIARGPFIRGSHHVPLPPDLPAGLYRCRLSAGGTTRAVPLALVR